jgi:hypothetical protein
MARLNETVKRDPARRLEDERQASLAARGVGLAAIMVETGAGRRRAMAEAERRLGLRWHNGSFGMDAGHYVGNHE